MCEKSYEPIDCHFYDELEASAVKKVNSKILYLDDKNEKKQCEGLIVDFIHINKAEYLVMKDGFKLRLDKIVKLNDKTAPQTPCNIKSKS